MAYGIIFSSYLFKISFKDRKIRKNKHRQKQHNEQSFKQIEQISFMTDNLDKNH